VTSTVSLPGQVSVIVALRVKRLFADLPADSNGHSHHHSQPSHKHSLSGCYVNRKGNMRRFSLNLHHRGQDYLLGYWGRGSRDCR
jgi:hypothetical protein